MRTPYQRRAPTPRPGLKATSACLSPSFPEDHSGTAGPATSAAELTLETEGQATVFGRCPRATGWHPGFALRRHLVRAAPSVAAAALLNQPASVPTATMSHPSSTRGLAKSTSLAKISDMTDSSRHLRRTIVIASLT